MSAAAPPHDQRVPQKWCLCCWPSGCSVSWGQCPVLPPGTTLTQEAGARPRLGAGERPAEDARCTKNVFDNNWGSPGTVLSGRAILSAFSGLRQRHFLVFFVGVSHWWSSALSQRSSSFWRGTGYGTDLQPGRLRCPCLKRLVRDLLGL